VPPLPSPEAEPIPPPRLNPELVGHEMAERELGRLYRAGRLPHAILFAGPRGIGKATLAFRLARFVLADGVQPALTEGLAIDPTSGVFRRVAAGGHADLLTVERAWDSRRRRLRGAIVVEDAREIANFLRLTPAEGGWRVVVVDGVDEATPQAANALLKILEEPPQRALLLLVARSAGKLLPTIRSRCRRWPLAPLMPAEVARLLRRFRPELAEADVAALSALAQGSIGRALDLAEAGGPALYRALIEIVMQMPKIDVAGLHAFADRLVRPEAEAAYRTVAEILPQFLARVASDAARRRLGGDEFAAGEGAALQRLAERADPARWAELCGEIEDNFARAEGLNLDKKQALLAGFFAIERAAR